jgi:hypothetical protein
VENDRPRARRLSKTAGAPVQRLSKTAARVWTSCGPRVHDRGKWLIH